ncbi:MAG: hypothetical protein ACTSXA_00690 [Candidatus Heimdallarchaeota archaeon]
MANTARELLGLDSSVEGREESTPVETRSHKLLGLGVSQENDFSQKEKNDEIFESDSWVPNWLQAAIDIGPRFTSSMMKLTGVLGRETLRTGKGVLQTMMNAPVGSPTSMGYSFNNNPADYNKPLAPELEAIVKPVEEAADFVKEKLEIASEAEVLQAKATGWPAKLTEAVAQSGAYMTGTAISSLVGGPAAGFNFAYQTMGGAMRETAIANGASEKEADVVKFLGGGIQAAIEFMQFRMLMPADKAKSIRTAFLNKTLTKLQKAKKYGVKAAMVMGGEGLEETMQEQTDMFVPPMVYGAKTPTWKEWWNRTLISFGGGAIMGEAFDLTFSGVRGVYNQANAKARKVKRTRTSKKYHNLVSELEANIHMDMKKAEKEKALIDTEELKKRKPDVQLKQRSHKENLLDIEAKQLPPVQKGKIRVYHGTSKDISDKATTEGLKTGKDLGTIEKAPVVFGYNKPTTKFGDRNIVADIPASDVEVSSGGEVRINRSINPDEIIGVIGDPKTMAAIATELSIKSKAQIKREKQAAARKVKAEANKSIRAHTKEQRMHPRQVSLLSKQVFGKEVKKLNTAELLELDDIIVETDVTENVMAGYMADRMELFGISKKSEDPVMNKLVDDILSRKKKKIKKSIERDIKRGKDNAKSKVPKGVASRIAQGIAEDNGGEVIDYPMHQIRQNEALITKAVTLNVQSIILGQDPKAVSADKNLQKQLQKDWQKLAVTLTKESNDRIANVLYYGDNYQGKDATNYVPFSELTEQEQNLVTNIKQIYQGALARQVMEERARIWIDQGKIPWDIQEAVKRKKMTVKERNALKKQLRKAYKNGTLNKVIDRMFYGQGNIKSKKFGLRETYYPASGEQESAVVDYLNQTTADALSERKNIRKEKAPDVTGPEGYGRRGVGTPKPGSVLANVLNAFVDVTLRNKLNKDIKGIYDKLNRMNLSNDDRIYYKELFSEILKQSKPMHPYIKPATKVNSAFWRLYMSVLTNPRVLYTTTRNAFQILAEGPQGISVKQYLIRRKEIMDSITNGTADPELMEDMATVFSAFVDQKEDIYKTQMFMHEAAKVKSTSKVKKGIDAINHLLEITGGMYVGVDSMERAMIFPVVYGTVKENAMLYHEGKISLNKFIDRTSVDTMMTDSQILNVLNMLEGRKFRDLSNYVATITTFDIFREYRPSGRASVDMTRQRRLFVKPYVYIHGVWDLYRRRGIRPLVRGIQSGNYGQAWRGAKSIAKGLLGRAISTAVLTKIGGETLGAGYSLYKFIGGFNLLQPGVDIAFNAQAQISRISNEVANGDKSISEGTEDIAKVIYNSSKRMLPLINIVESITPESTESIDHSKEKR